MTKKHRAKKGKGKKTADQVLFRDGVRSALRQIDDAWKSRKR